jgi:hypothetical protein
LSRRVCHLLLLVVLFAGSGANCPQILRQYTQPEPRVLSEHPSLDEVVHVVNSNSSRVHSLYATQARLSIPNFLPASADLAWERPRRFRLRATLAGPQADIGSNDEIFWFWVRQNEPPALYFCRHDQFNYSPLRRMIPFEPAWLTEALGVVSFDPHSRIAGPFAGRGRLDMHTIQETPAGRVTKVTVIDDARGWVLEQHLYDAQGQPLARALMRDHRRDPLHQVTLPRTIELQWPSMQVSLTLALRDLEINLPLGDSPQLWAKPTYAGYPDIDLAQGIPTLHQPNDLENRALQRYPMRPNIYPGPLPYPASQSSVAGPRPLTPVP